MKKYLLIAFLFLLATVPAFSQDSGTPIPYQMVEVKPSFNGGDVQLFSSWVYKHMQYPEEARKNNIQGRVVVSFIVEVDGSVTNVTVLKGVEATLDAEAVRAVSSSHRWAPGVENGKPVRVSVNLPIIFKINEKKAVSDDDPIPFQLVEKKPSFMGGDANAFSVWVNSRLVYPESAKANGIQGRVVVQFTIEDDGRLTNVKVLSGVDPALDAEALRVVKSSPRWVPGRQGDKSVKVIYTFPVVFGLR